MEQGNKEFSRLVKIMDELREQCPWDKKQTIQTLRSMTIEETYELADAITDNDWQRLKEELGDLLLHIVFYSRIGREENRFSVDDVIRGICDKLIARHPHIYGDLAEAGLSSAETAEEVKRNWEKLKLKEGKDSVLSGLPGSLPAISKAMRIQEKAKQVGFEWDHSGQVWQKVEEEMGELVAAVASEKQDRMEEEMGDVLFSLVNYCRFIGVDAENALEKTNKKFISRFQEMEKEAAGMNRRLHDMTLEEMDALWNEVKKKKK